MSVMDLATRSVRVRIGNITGLSVDSRALGITMKSWLSSGNVTAQENLIDNQAAGIG